MTLCREQHGCVVTCLAVLEVVVTTWLQDLTLWWLVDPGGQCSPGCFTFS